MIMTYTVEDAIRKLLTDRAPNLVRESILRGRLSSYDSPAIISALDTLVKNGSIREEMDMQGSIGRAVRYFSLPSFSNVAIRESIRIGDSEVPRVLSESSVKYLPENLNETVERMSEFAGGLERRFEEILRKQLREYWATIVTVFGVFVAIIALVTASLPRIATGPSQRFWDVLWLNLAQVIPVALVLALFVIALFLVVRRF
jgi:hypothetical protein